MTITVRQPTWGEDVRGQRCAGGVAPRRGRTGKLVGVLWVVGAVVTACSDGGGAGSLRTTTVPVPASTESSDADGPIASGSGAVTLLSLASSEVQPFGRVSLDGIEVTVAVDDSGAPVTTTVPDISQLELFMYVPGLDPVPVDLFVVERRVEAAIGMHPVAPFEGGSVELQFVEGENRGPALPLDLGGLAPAPGAWDTAVSALMSELDRRAAAAATTLEQLAQAAPADLDADLRIIKLVAGVFDDGSEHDVSSVADDLDEDALQLLDAIVGRLDVLATVPTDTAEPAGIRSLSPHETHSEIDADVGRSSPIMGLAHPRQLSCTDFPLDIDDGATLSAMIEKGVSSAMGPATAKLTGDVSALNAGVGKLNDAFGVAGGPVGGAVGAASNATAALDALYTGLNLWSAMDAGRYPSQLRSMQMQVSIVEFNEDFVSDGVVQSAEVTATSTGFDAASYGALASSLTNVAVGGAASNVTKSGLGLRGQVGDAIGLGLDKVRETATGKALTTATGVLTDWCPRSWTVDIVGAQFVELKSAFGNLSVDDPGLGYRPKHVGNDFLTVSARPSAFAGLSVSAQFPIRIHELQVVATPSLVEIDAPGSIVQITASAEYADTPSLDWDPGAGSWNDGAGRETPTTATRPLRTPTDQSAYPVTVTITSTSETGLREGKSRSDPRDDEVTIVLQDFIVVPDPGNVIVGRTLQFAALDLDGAPVAVAWSATGGRIGADGVYHAGDRAGTYTVTATSKADPTKSVTVVVVVGDAECLVGTWELRSQEFLERLFAATGNSAISNVNWRGGSYQVVMEGGGGYTSREGSVVVVGRHARRGPRHHHERNDIGKLVGHAGRHRRGRGCQHGGGVGRDPHRRQRDATPIRRLTLGERGRDVRIRAVRVRRRCAHGHRQRRHEHVRPCRMMHLGLR